MWGLQCPQAALLPPIALLFPLDSAAKKGTTPQEQLLTIAVLGDMPPPPRKPTPIRMRRRAQELDLTGSADCASHGLHDV